MPAERTRASNSQGRQKSCSECARGKRRCDLRQPACGRCSRLNLACTWPPSPPSHASSTPTAETSLANNDSTLEHMPQMETTSSWPCVDMSDMPTSLDSTFFDLGLNLSPAFYDLGGGMDTETTIALPPLSAPNPSLKLPSLLGFSTMAESRIGYSMKQWEKAPLMMVKENCTYWSHSRLYEECMPQSMADAYAACALTMTRNKTNARFIARHIAEKAYELAAKSLPTQPLEVLARGHALLLYMILMISSGDIRCIAQVQNLLPHLQSSATSIFHLLTSADKDSTDEDSADFLPTYPATIAQAAWTSFIFRESSRRTLLVICHAIAACNVMTGDVTSCSHELAVGNRVTISAALWNATSAFEFAKVWNEKRHWLVKDLDFKDVLEDAQAEDLDVFGRMILIGSLGIDDVRGWLHMRGAEL